MTFQLSLERVKPIGWQGQFVRRRRYIERGQNAEQLDLVPGIDAFGGSGFEQVSQTLMPKTDDHSTFISRNDTRCNALRCSERVGDRVTPVAAEVPLAELDAWRCLAAFVFGDAEQALDPRHRVAVKAASGDLIDR